VEVKKRTKIITQEFQIKFKQGIKNLILKTDNQKAFIKVITVGSGHTLLLMLNYNN